MLKRKFIYSTVCYNQNIFCIFTFKSKVNQFSLMATNQKNISSSLDKEKVSSEIKGMFYLLQTNTEKFLEEVNKSYELFKIGDKTEITKRLEKIATEYSPGQMEAELVSKLLNTLRMLGKSVVIDGFINKSDYLDEAVILSENDRRIMFGLVPKEESEESLRKDIAKFYAQTSHWNMFRYTEPLFQVIPKDLLTQINFQERIE